MVLDLCPDARVVGNLQDVGYAPAGLNQATVFLTGYEKPVELNEFPLGPFGARVRSIPWDPVDPTDIVYYVSDSYVTSMYIVIGLQSLCVSFAGCMLWIDRNVKKLQ